MPRNREEATLDSMILRALPLVASVGLFGLGCAGGPPKSALENRTFYAYDDAPTSSGRNPFESPYPALDAKPSGGAPAYVGVAILGGTVRLSRPAGWRIRRASLAEGRRYVEYVSPEEYLFAIYERSDAAGAPWREVLGRYEEDAKAKGAELLGARIAVATWNTQGKEYVVKRTVRGQRAPFTSLSREFLLRSENRVDLVEIVHQGETPVAIASELVRVMETLEVL